MVRVGTVIPAAINGDRISGTLSGNEVRQKNLEDVVGFEQPNTREFLLDRVALGHRSGIEMGVKPCRRIAIEAAYRNHARQYRACVVDFKA